MIFQVFTKTFLQLWTAKNLWIGEKIEKKIEKFRTLYANFREEQINSNQRPNDRTTHRPENLRSYFNVQHSEIILILI